VGPASEYVQNTPSLSQSLVTVVLVPLSAEAARPPRRRAPTHQSSPAARAPALLLRPPHAATAWCCSSRRLLTHPRWNARPVVAWRRLPRGESRASNFYAFMWSFIWTVRANFLTRSTGHMILK